MLLSGPLHKSWGPFISCLTVNFIEYIIFNFRQGVVCVVQLFSTPSIILILDVDSLVIS